MKVREDMFTAGFRPRLATPMLLAILGRLKDRDQAAVLSKAGYRSAETELVMGFAQEADEAAKELSGRKLNAPIDAYRFIEKMRSIRLRFCSRSRGIRRRSRKSAHT